MDKIASITSLIDGIVSVYDQQPFKNRLQKRKNELCAIFERLLFEYAKKNSKYNLISNNSVRDIKYFSVVGRVKETDSFHEKLIRGNLIYPLLEKGALKTKADISTKRQKVQNVAQSS